ncbi:MAG: polyribonucleotide nucleotidyltransferase [Bacteroidales bacterium]|nr:polyribonucleotide nucleotidyltransferase [Bacteroidales bacterium]MDE6112795.1 polyribonucleotide nucleotidyltransferase [Bacteroidales bacterium]
MLGIQKKFNLPDGREVMIETGKLAKQADGSVVVKCGNTMILATVCSKAEAGENVDFMPLTVDYQEKYAAVGRFPGGFFKREARLSEYEILISRLIDRALRPLFPDNYHAETQVLVTLISGDRDTQPDAFAALAASAALSVSDIPFHGPISEVRVARIDGKFVINPSTTDLERADLELMVGATIDDISMVEGEMKEVSEEVMIEALKAAHEAIKVQCQVQMELAKEVGKAKREYNHETNDDDLRRLVEEKTYQKCYDAARECVADKKLRGQKIDQIKADFIAENFTPETLEGKEFMIARYFHDVHRKAVRDMILKERIRLDGRGLEDIRPIWCEADYLPSAHGSAIFTRGETQSLSTVTLGSKLDEQTIDGAIIEGKNSFLLHYNFPSFATGEVKPQRGTSRRETGHGNLAMRALKQVLPKGADNPYTIRVVSDILESNGSSSMATVCAGCLALMDAGVKISKPVSGIAMGLITDPETGNYAVLSDILGDEDHLGDMDFKVCGTRDGITACQMDIKIDGLSYDILAKALMQAKQGRAHILGKMLEVLPEPRADYKPHAPRIVQITIPREFIGAVIGTGGKVIQELQRETNTQISIEEVGEIGVIDIAGNNKEGMDAALERIKAITAVPEVGEVYHGTVRNIQPFGAFIEILPGKDGLLHISEMSWKRLEKVEDMLKEGDEIDVKLIDVDPKTGKLKLSHKVLTPKPEGYKEPEPRERRPREDRGDRRDRGERREREVPTLSAPKLRSQMNDAPAQPEQPAAPANPGDDLLF